MLYLVVGTDHTCKNSGFCFWHTPKLKEKSRYEMKQHLRNFANKFTGKQPISQEEKLRFVIIACLVVHVLLLELFTIFGAFVMVIYSLIVIGYYMYVASTVKRKKIALGYALTYVEILVTVVMGTLFVGWGCGFHMYFFAVVPGAFFMLLNVEGLREKFWMPIVVTFACLGVYLGMFIYSLNATPFLDVNQEHPNGTLTFYIFNTVIAFLFIATLSYLFVLEMRGSSDIMMAKNQELANTASVDPLTSLYNRRHMETMLEMAMDKAKQRGTLFSLIMGDIDNFKRINDTYGHECGDQALLMVSEVMRRCVREGDAVCRWGGEEFLLLIQGNQEIAVNVAERIRNSIEREKVEYQGQEIKFTITFGVTTYVPGFPMETLIRQADDHLYIGKTTGKNKVVV